MEDSTWRLINRTNLLTVIVSVCRRTVIRKKYDFDDDDDDDNNNNSNNNNNIRMP
jgi:hypothetical protein